MTCQYCAATFRGVVCAACRIRRQRAGILLHQRRYLYTWLQGAIDLRIVTIDGIAHVELFDDRWHGYCGARLGACKPDERVKMRELPADLCADCRAVFDNLVENERRKPWPQ